jgi:hypothetical protein
VSLLGLIKPFNHFCRPWKIPANKRTPKDPTAPKRPMSAFLAFSNSRRAALKRVNPTATNADLSKMLSKTWKETPEELRKEYTEIEAELRAQYKVLMGAWRKKSGDEKKLERKERESLAMEAAEARQQNAAAEPQQQEEQKQMAEQMVSMAQGHTDGNDLSNGQHAAAMTQSGLYGMHNGSHHPFQFPNEMGGLMQGGAGGFNQLLGSNPFGAQNYMPNAAALQQLQLQQLLCK